ncbi:MAG: hypothetical protein K0S39_3478 [Paenibacillus sp.]|jgi:hypothetical protein|nr:hypothetical protein [Paenibacillus sp.]
MEILTVKQRHILILTSLTPTLILIIRGITRIGLEAGKAVITAIKAMEAGMAVIMATEAGLEVTAVTTVMEVGTEVTAVTMVTETGITLMMVTMVIKIRVNTVNKDTEAVNAPKLSRHSSRGEKESFSPPKQVLLYPVILKESKKSIPS